MKLHILLLVAAGCALSACGQTKQAVAVGGQTQPGASPEVSQAPLSVPPNYDMAATPSSAAPAQQGTASGGTPDATQSSGEQALLQTAGASSPDPNIRKTIDQEATAGVATSQELMDKLAFWQNSAIQAATTGAAPTIKRRTKSVMDSIF